MNIEETYKAIINHSIENSDVPTTDHLIEEMAELTQELCKDKRRRTCNIFEELADVLFQIDKYLLEDNKSIDDLRKLSIAKSCVKYPDFMETLS